MADIHRHRTPIPQLSDQEFEDRWDEIVTAVRRPKLRRADAAWSSLGEDYGRLPPQSSPPV